MIIPRWILLDYVWAYYRPTPHGIHDCRPCSIPGSPFVVLRSSWKRLEFNTCKGSPWYPINILPVWEREIVLCRAFPDKRDVKHFSSRADPGFWKGEGNHEGLWNESGMPTRWRRRRCWGRVWEEVKPPLAGGSGGASPRNFSTVWCFLLQSRHSSALLPRLLIQAYINLKKMQKFTK